MMRLIALFLIMASLVFADGFPKVFSSAGDDVYSNMNKYLKIKDLDVYADKPELLESFCNDANASMQRGYVLDKMQEDPEAAIDKTMIKSYARELRRLSSQDEAIQRQLRTDISKLYEEKDFKALSVFRSADIELSQEIVQAIEAHEKKRKQEEALAIVIAKSKEAERLKAEELEKSKLAAETSNKKAIAKVVEKPLPVATPKPKEVHAPVKVAVVKVPEVTAPKPVLEEMPPAPVEKKVLTKLEYYEQNMMSLKDELYELRESGDQAKMACLNDITAINYWMISLLKNEKDPCMVRDAIKQMKSYDKSSVNSCGRDSIRYMEWHGRIKPYVGSTLFQAEASCNR